MGLDVDELIAELDQTASLHLPRCWPAPAPLQPRMKRIYTVSAPNLNSCKPDW